MEERKIQDKINKYASLGLCLLLLVTVLCAFFAPIIYTEEFSLRPFDLVASRLIEDISFGNYTTLIASYYIYKYFYIAFAIVSASFLFLALFYFITKNDNFQKCTNVIMCITLVFLLVSMLIGFNYINIYNITDLLISSTSAHIFFFAGLALIFIKFIVNAVFGKKNVKEELRESGLSVSISFVQTLLVLGTLFTPLYIFPGTKYRMSGIDILLGKEDILSFLPMSGVYKVIILIFIICVTVSFLINIFLFILNRNAFIQHNKINIFLGLIALVLYALMGLNYMIVYIDAKAYSHFFNTSMNTYSYIPLVLLILFLLGSEFTKMATSKLNIVYKVNAPDVSGNGNSLSAGTNGKSYDNGILDPIPAFSEIDKRIEEFSADYQQRAEHLFSDITLPKLVSHIIEYAKYSNERLSYGATEVKTFIAGLAASRLSILQGMSGTGKTSLPKIFMEAIDGICELVAVESSWRDKNELLGYYNEFNKKYTPKSFTQFLYKASLNKEIPHFIVLDEMNLSRIEYYFSDFLSLMEARENSRHIKLFDVQLYPHIDERKKYLALRDGHTIDIPTNVWFIGTANRDESTFEISDKVYDRAQTINFDKRAPKVNITEPVHYPKRFVPYQELRKLFDESKLISFDAESYETIKKVENLLRPYKISFGNRILKQIEEFVRVYVACSQIATAADRIKYVHEAVDCIIFSKVVRKLEFKQVIDIDSLIEEFTSLKLPKCEEFLRTLTETA